MWGEFLVIGDVCNTDCAEVMQLVMWMSVSLSVCLSIGRLSARDVHQTFWAETETLGILSETRPRRDVFNPRRGRDWDVAAPETLAETYGEKI